METKEKFCTNYPLVSSVEHTLRPEDKNNRMLHTSWIIYMQNIFDGQTPFKRSARFMNLFFQDTSEVDKFFQRYSHRTNT